MSEHVGGAPAPRVEVHHVVLAGTGRTATAIATTRASGGGDPRAVEIAASTAIAHAAEPDAVRAAMEAALSGPGRV